LITKMSCSNGGEYEIDRQSITRTTKRVAVDGT